jgi:hypothetical protein
MRPSCTGPAWEADAAQIEKAADDFSGRARGFLQQLADHDRGDRAALSEVRAMMMSDLEGRVVRRRCHRDGAV